MSGRFALKSGIAVAIVAIALPVRAQSQPPSPRGYLVGFGGAASTQVTSPFFGGTVGVNLTPDLQITAEISRAQDVLSKFTKEDLATLDREGSAEMGVPFASSVKMPTNFYTGGIRYLLPIGGPARPYVAASGGAAHMSPAPSYRLNGIDVTSVISTEMTSLIDFREETRPMASLAGGVAFTVAKHLAFDLGYRYSTIFIHSDYLQHTALVRQNIDSPTTHTRLDTHRVYAGVGWAF